MVEENKTKREEFVVKIGPLLRSTLNKQKELINEHTYGCVKGSDYEAGEIVAKKVEGDI